MSVGTPDCLVPGVGGWGALGWVGLGGALGVGGVGGVGNWLWRAGNGLAAEIVGGGL